MLAAAGILAAALSLALAAPAAAAPRFAEGLAFPAGVDPTSVATGDFDADGRLDLLVGGEGVWLLRGRPLGRLAPARQLVDRVFEATVVAADLDGDGHLDAAVGDTAARGVLLLFGDGRGGFPRRAEPAAGQVLALATGDVDGDARPELLAPRTVRDGEGEHGELLVLDPRALATRSVTRLDGLPRGMVTGDLDGDGHDDAVLKLDDPLRVVLARSGAGPVEPLQLCGDPAQVRAGAVLALCGRRLELCPGGAGCRAVASLPRRPDALAFADFDRDGVQDVLAGSSGWNGETSFGAGVRLLLGRGDGGLRAPAFSRSVIPLALAAGDFNRDGRLDAAALDGVRNRVQLLFGRPVGRGTALAGPRSRLLIRTRRARVNPSFGGVVVRLRCTRGRVGCAGELRLGRGGAPVAFSIRAGRTRAVRVELTRTNFRRARAWLSVRWTSGRVSGPVTLLGATAAARRAACLPRGVRLLARTRHGTMFRRDGTYVVCAWSTGRHRGVATEHGPVAMRGRWVAYGEGFCEDRCLKSIALMDVRGRHLHPQRGPDPRPACVSGDEFDVCADSVRRIVVSHRGAIAWITCAARRDDPGDLVGRCGRDRLPVAVVRSDSRGVRVLDRGRGLRGLRLSRDGRRLSWRDGSRRRIAMLAGRAQGAIGSAVG